MHFPAAVIGTAAYPSGGFGTPLIFLVWCYMSWGVFLFVQKRVCHESQPDVFSQTDETPINQAVFLPHIL